MCAEMTRNELGQYIIEFKLEDFLNQLYCKFNHEDSQSKDEYLRGRINQSSQIEFANIVRLESEISNCGLGPFDSLQQLYN